MWNDILIIAAFILAGLTYFGLVRGRLSKYTETAKDDTPRRSVYYKTTVFVGVAASLFYLFSLIWESDTFRLSTSLMFMSILLCLWGGMLVLQLSERTAKVVRVLAYSALLPVLIAGVILSDLLLWQKLVCSLGGVGVGFGLGWLTDYLEVKLKRRRSFEEGDRQP